MMASPAWLPFLLGLGLLGLLDFPAEASPWLRPASLPLPTSPSWTLPAHADGCCRGASSHRESTSAPMSRGEPLRGGKVPLGWGLPAGGLRVRDAEDIEPPPWG